MGDKDKRIAPDGAYHSGLMKDYGGSYNPDYEDRSMSMEEVSRCETEITRLRAALGTIASGHTTRFPGAPDVMAETPESFRSKMWSWSQAVARAALEE